MTNSQNNVKQIYLNLEHVDRQIRSAQVAQALVFKALRGEFPGKAPIGYINDTITKRIVPDSKSWTIVKEALENYATGEVTIGWVTRFLNEKLPSVQQCERKPLTRSQVNAILQNPFYAGIFTFQDRVFCGKHKPMITEKIFDRIQERSKGVKM